MKLHRSICCTSHRKHVQFRFRLRRAMIVLDPVASGFGFIADMAHSRRDDARKAEVPLPPAA